MPTDQEPGLIGYRLFQGALQQDCEIIHVGIARR
jgi:hypothetical protein